MIPDMEPVHVTEAELARNIGSLLDRVESGLEIVIERGAKPVAILRAPEPRRRKLSEILAALSETSTATLDPEFEADVDEFIRNHREPLTPPDWD